MSLRNSGVVASAGRDGGSVNLFNSGSAFLKNSIVNSEALNNGGNIEIRSPRVLILDSSYLNANAIRGNGGNISVAADGFLPSIDSLMFFTVSPIKPEKAILASIACYAFKELNTFKPKDI